MMAGHSLWEVTAFVTSAAVGMAQVASSPWWTMLYPLSYASINYLELFRGEIEIPDDISEHRVMGVCPALPRQGSMGPSGPLSTIHMEKAPGSDFKAFIVRFQGLEFVFRRLC